MKKNRISSLAMLAVHLFTLLLMVLLLFGARGYVNAGAQVDAVTYVNHMIVSVDGGPEQRVTLPYSFKPLAPRTRVTLRASIFPEEYDTVYIKSVYSPAKIYLDGKPCFQFGLAENYPRFMLDPATEHHMVETHGTGMPMELRMEFDSPVSRKTMTIYPPLVGTAKEITLERCHALGMPLILAMAQIIYGISLLLISICLLLVDKKGESFLWLGLIALMSGLWVFGENNFTGFMFKNATMLYLLSFIGMFTFIIPLLHFTRFVVDFENPRPIWYMELFATFCAGLALLLQFLGVMQCSTSMYFFHAMLPLMLLVLTVSTAWEAFRYHNTNARRFVLPLSILLATGLMELVNYRINITYVFASLFQLGTLFFLLVMGITAGLAVKESVSIKNRSRELSFEKGLMEIQIQEQESRSQLLSQHEQQLSRQRHDLRHHLNAIMEMAGDNPELQAYLQGLTQQIPSAGRTICENRTVNAILTHYEALCAQKKIRLTMEDLVIPAENPGISDSKLCVIFGNLLENAVEACSRMTEGEKFITLEAHLKNGMLVISMENSFNGKVQKEGTRFLSSKRREYGIGLASVQSVAREHGGEAQFEGQGTVFISRLYLRL